MTSPSLRHGLLAEFLGTGLLVSVVVSSGIAAQQLSPNDVGLQLLENSTATVLGLSVLILMFGPVSGAHFNPWCLLPTGAHQPEEVPVTASARPALLSSAPTAPVAPPWAPLSPAIE